MNLCSKPGCGGPGAAVLAYDYSAGSARLDDPPEVPISPHLYVLCDRCATSLRAPRGWILEDRRSKAVVVGPPDIGQMRPPPRLPAEEEHDHGGQRQLAFGYSA